jgi:hypothetical protein
MNGTVDSRQVRMFQVRELLGELERMTPSRQPTVMEDILRQLRSEALDPDACFRPSERQVVVASLDELEHEIAKPVPEPETFDRKAQILIDVFAIA